MYKGDRNKQPNRMKNYPSEIEQDDYRSRRAETISVEASIVTGVLLGLIYTSALTSDMLLNSARFNDDAPKPVVPIAMFVCFVLLLFASRSAACNRGQ